MTVAASIKQFSIIFIVATVIWSRILLAEPLKEKNETNSKLLSTNVKLNNGAEYPLLGFGAFNTQGRDLEKALNTALKLGYRNIDLKSYYGNLEVVGNVLNKWIASGQLKRENVFVTLKLSPETTKPDLITKNLKRSLKQLALNYVDLLLADMTILPHDIMEEDPPLPVVWKEMKSQTESGEAKAIGLAGYFDMTEIKKYNQISPAVVDIPFYYINYQQQMLTNVYIDLGIMAKLENTELLFDHYLIKNSRKTIEKIAANHGKTIDQILARYVTQRNIAVISTKEEELAMLSEIFHFSLTQEEMEVLKQMDEHRFK